MTDPRFPIGRFRPRPSYTPADRADIARRIATLPQRLEAALAGMNDAQLDTRYREDGWTVRQVVHHVSDSHVNAYTRVKLTLTETNPSIRPYNEKEWALTAEVKGSIGISLALLKAVHAKLAVIISGLREADYSRTYYHPENKTQATLDVLLDTYAWHGDHHLAHIAGLKSRMGW
jgi:hypothetical protein